MNDKEILKIVQAHMDGEEIEQKRIGGKWSSFDGVWKFSLYDYQIKKPKQMEFWGTRNLAGDITCIIYRKEDAPKHAIHFREVLPEEEDDSK